MLRLKEFFRSLFAKPSTSYFGFKIQTGFRGGSSTADILDRSGS